MGGVTRYPVQAITGCCLDLRNPGCDLPNPGFGIEYCLDAGADVSVKREYRQRLLLFAPDKFGRLAPEVQLTAIVDCVSAGVYADVLAT